MSVNFFGLGCAIGVLLVLAVPKIGRSLKARARQREMRANVAAFNREFEKTNPPGPPLTSEEKADFEAFVAGLAMPAVALAPADGDAQPGGTRLGGPVWLAEGETWPMGKDGTAMEFVAQIDFAELPPLPDFPARGVLQFFIANDDLFGVDFDDLAAGDIALRWHEDFASPGRLEPPPPLDPEHGCSPLMEESVRARGRILAGTAVVQKAQWGDWRVDQRGDGWRNRPGFRELEDALIGEAEPCHHVGGQPAFTQNDPRSDPRYQGHDRCLLRVTSDDAIMWGDVGEAVWLIPQAALRAKDWSQVIFSWDCH